LYNLFFSKKSIVYANFLTIFLAVFYSLVFYDIAYLLTFFILYAIFFLYILYVKSNDILSIFSILLPIYIFTSFFIAFDYENAIGVPYGYADESLFYYLGLYNHLDMLPTDFHFIHSFTSYIELIDFPAYFEFLKLQGDFYNFIGYQSFMAFKLISIFVGIVGILIFFKISQKFFSTKESKILALIFGLLPLVVYQSSVLMRDIIIFSLSLYVVLVLLTLNTRNILTLIGTLLLIYLFRPENGLFMLVLSLVYYTINISKDKFSKSLMLISILIVSIFVLILFKDKIIYLVDSFSHVQDGYLARGLEHSSSSSLGAKLRTLPFPINNVSVFIVSQMSPFPFWGLVTNSISPIIEGIGGFVWYFIWPFVIIALYKQNIRRKIDSRLFLLFLLFFVYIFLVANIQPMQRRLMVGYPFVLMVAYYGYKYTSGKEKAYLSLLSFVFILILYSVYLLLKGL